MVTGIDRDGSWNAGAARPYARRRREEAREGYGRGRGGGPPDEHARQQVLAQLVADLAAGRVPREELVRTILRLGREGYVMAWARVEPYLEDPEPAVRRAALQVLVSDWKMDQYRERCEELCDRDSDPDVRRFASTCLGILYQSTGDRRTLRRLADAVRREHESPRIRGAAYVSILRVLGKKGRDIPFIGNADDLAARVDWRLVEACAAERWDEVPTGKPA